MISSKMRLWVVRSSQTGTAVIIVNANEREGAKKNAQRWLGSNPDRYVVDPITNVDDMVRIEISIS